MIATTCSYCIVQSIHSTECDMPLFYLFCFTQPYDPDNCLSMSNVTQTSLWTSWVNIRMFTICSCWLRNLWKSFYNSFWPKLPLSAIHIHEIQLIQGIVYSYHAVRYPVWLLAFTDANRGLFTCIQNTIARAVRVKALACCNDSLTQWLNEWDGVLLKILDLYAQTVVIQEPAHALGHYDG